MAQRERRPAARQLMGTSVGGTTLAGLLGDENVGIGIELAPGKAQQSGRTCLRRYYRLMIVNTGCS